MTILHLVLTLLVAPYPTSIKSPGAILCSQLASSSCISVVKLTFVSQKPFLRMLCPTLMICINMLTHPCILMVKNLYWMNIFIFNDLFFVDIADCFPNIFHIVTIVDVCKLHIHEFFTNKMRMLSLLFLFGYGTTHSWIPNSKCSN